MRGILRKYGLPLTIFLLLAGCAGKPNPFTSDAEVTHLVEGFGKKLHTVSLLSPNMSIEMHREYSEFVAPALLDSWLSNPTNAPGRMVSSPWPDRIEITSLAHAPDGSYVVEGRIIEITSWELVNGGTADTIPIRVTVQWLDGRWQIVEFLEIAG